ncbi:MAG TPA: efflux RND transporter periplasmic adaptor subunit [Xanthobacteraceae bacterium]|nr:efflux RND transporter periplasmic adaptor subunit [Xanthobacteraceae bacterium]
MTSSTKTISAALATLAAIGLSGCDNTPAAAPPAPPPPSVSVSVVKPEAVPLRYQYAGRIAAFREVEIRARVQGILQEKTFTEGATVKAGDVLFRIDPATYEAQLARAQAQLQEAKAQVERTRRDSERASTLFQRNVGTEKARDDAHSAHALALASVAGAEAQLRTAEINLGYTTITAPIGGITSLRVMPEGSLVGTGADNSLLTHITQLDPVYVNFSFTNSEAVEIRQLIDSGEAKISANGKLQVAISFGDGRTYPQKGVIDFTDSNLDLKTGTLRSRAVVTNPDKQLRPGEFVRVSVEGVTRLNAIVVPQVAVMQGAQGQYVYTLDAENKASVRPVTIGREVDKGWIVEKGLKEGDRIVTEGIIKVRPGQAVTVASAKDAAKSGAPTQ